MSLSIWIPIIPHSDKPPEPLHPWEWVVMAICFGAPILAMVWFYFKYRK